jgi:hypothetical protein
VFRRDRSYYESARFKLRGLTGNARYRLTNLDTSEAKEMAGRELMEQGLVVGLTKAPGSALIRYQEF